MRSSRRRKAPESTLPKTIGTLAICAACIGGIGSFIYTIGPLGDLRRTYDVGGVIVWLYIWAVLSAALFVVHIAGATLATKYRLTGLRTLTWYAVLAILLVFADLLIIQVVVRHPENSSRYWRLHDSFAQPRRWFDVAALVWPIIVLTQVNRSAARAACK